MTPQEKVVAWARSQVGYRATSAKRNKYAEKLDKLGYVYNGAKNGYDWCDVFADSAYIECFGAETAIKMIAQPKYGCGAGCPWSADYYRRAGQWSEQPSLGAQIFFGTRGDEYHTGIVVGYDSYNVHTVEGNVGGGGGMVGERTHYRYSGISGYGVPNWSLAGGSSPAPQPSKLIVDGDFGTLTCKALQEALQSHGYYKDCIVDGYWGHYTKLALQQYLRALGYYTTAYILDGWVGPATVKALQTYLRKLGYYGSDYIIDGDWGYWTTCALQRALNDGKF